ncbi:MAG: hypothetical protein ABR565_00775 [Gammaproteobacteria bacterium]
MKIKSTLLVVLFLLGNAPVHGDTVAPRSNWSVFTGKYTSDGLPDEILMNQPIEFQDAWISVLNYGRHLSKPTPSRRWEAEAQFGIHRGLQDHHEFNVAMIHRWSDWPWDGLIDTSFALGVGVSWAAEVPALEAQGEPGEHATRTLLYLALEFEAMPRHTRRWSVYGRIHHRSGVFGTIKGVHGGSDHVGIGLRWYPAATRQ